MVTLDEHVDTAKYVYSRNQKIMPKLMTASLCFYVALEGIKLPCRRSILPTIDVDVAALGWATKQQTANQDSCLPSDV